MRIYRWSKFLNDVHSFNISENVRYVVFIFQQISIINVLHFLFRLDVVKREAQFPFGFSPGFGAGYGSNVFKS
jgi:hypothetical protein